MNVPLSRLDFPESELVLALVYPAGTNTGPVVDSVTNGLHRFGYRPNIVRLSAFLKHYELKTRLSDSSEAERVSSRMDAGNEARERTGRNDLLALAAVADIRKKRQEKPLPKEAHVLLSLKRPEEVLALRRIYGSGFYLIGVFATAEERLRYLHEDKNVPRPDAEELVARDQEESHAFGQRTRDTFHLADIFVRAHPVEDSRTELWRFLDLIFGNPFTTPTSDENAMLLAYSASTRSGDLARQVGASVTSERGDVIAVGSNDVPRFGGGLYWPGPDDQRDHKKGHDSNAKQRNKIVADVMKGLCPRTRAAERQAEFRRLVPASPLLDLTEYGRAVHAEMEALLSCTRSGVSPVGGTLYSTTFPCHNCTRHIVGAGIRRVVYVEPYSKSKAAILHDDAIEIGEDSNPENDTPKPRVRFEPFVGIGPRRYFDLFSLRLSTGFPIERKSADGVNRADWSRETTRLRIPLLPSSYLEREDLAVTEISESIDSLKVK